MIGNGITDPLIQYISTTAPWLAAKADTSLFWTLKLCERMDKDSPPNCAALAKDLL